MNRVALAVTTLALASCTAKVVDYELTVVTTGCGGSNPFQAVQFLRIRVSGEGIATPLESMAAATEKATVLPDIPAGTGRVIEVRAYDGDPAQGGKVVSMGKTLPFDVPSVVPEKAAVDPAEFKKRVFLRQVGAWSRVVSAEEPSSCQSMRSARAAHTATLLPNGKVLIAGGFAFAPGTANRVSLQTTELFNPADGTFAKAEDLSFVSPDKVITKVAKAFHTATLIGNGQVLVWGGETYQMVGGAMGAVPSGYVLLYDSAKNSFGVRARTTPPPIARTQHVAVADKDGRVLVIGGLGLNTSGTGPRLIPVPELEFFDIENPIPQVVPSLTAKRVDAAAGTVAEFVVVAGGTDGVALRDDTAFYSWNGTTFAQASVQPKLAAGRRNAAAAPLKNGADLMLLGGFSDATALKPLASSEVVQSGSNTVVSGSPVGPRGNLCAVALGDGSVLTVGGRTADANGMMVKSDNSVVMVRSDGTGGAPGPNLTVPRYLHTCTLLADGSVLVTGGVNETLANPKGEVLSDAWIYVPTPAE